MPYLVTTKIDYGLLKNKKKKLINSFDFSVVNESEKNIWQNKRELINDFKYCNKITHSLSYEISEYLYKYHEGKLSKEKFRELIYFWLIYYVQVNYNKWKTIKKFNNKKFSFVFLNTPKIELIDNLDFLQKNQSNNIHNYNYYKNIILYLKDQKKLKIHLNYSFKKKFLNQKKNKKNLIFLNIIILISKIENFFFKKKYLFIDSLNKKFFFMINILKIQLPIKFIYLFNWKVLRDYAFFFKKKRKNTFVKIKKKKDEFYNYIIQNFDKNIPICYLESFDFLSNLANHISIKPKKVLSGYAHFYNELFKLWSAKNNKEIQFYNIQHGGNYLKVYDVDDYERKFNKENIVWEKFHKGKNIRSLPIINYFFQKKVNYEQNSNIIFCGNEIYNYVARITAGPLDKKEYDVFNKLKKLYLKIDKRISSNFYYIPKRLLKSEELKEINFIPKKNYKKPASLKYQLKKSRLVICSYPITSFADSIQKVPTILFCNDKQWIFHNNMKKVFHQMKKNKLFFNDPNKLADHINRIYEDIEKWWNDINVINTRKLFLSKFNIPQDKSIEKWSKLLK